MTSILNHTSLPSEVAKSFRSLQGNARGSTEIADWFTENVKYLGELPEHLPGSLKVSVRMEREVVSVLLTNNTVGFRAVLDLTMSTYPLPQSSLGTLVGLSELQLPYGLRFVSNFDLAFSEWPFTVAELVFDYVSNEGYAANTTTEWHDHSKMLIDRYISVHFPGMTLSKLETLAEMELLTKDDSANLKENRLALDKQAFFKILFSTRMGPSVEQLPPDMAI